MGPVVVPHRTSLRVAPGNLSRVLSATGAMKLFLQCMRKWRVLAEWDDGRDGSAGDHLWCKSQWTCAWSHSHHVIPLGISLEPPSVALEEFQYQTHGDFASRDHLNDLQLFLEPLSSHEPYSLPKGVFMIRRGRELISHLGDRVVNDLFGCLWCVMDGLSKTSCFILFFVLILCHGPFLFHSPLLSHDRFKRFGSLFCFCAPFFSFLLSIAS